MTVIDKYTINTPIGYAKSPYGGPISYGGSKAESHISKGPDQNFNTSSSSASFEKLPFEIRAKIANELSQFDCLNLLQVSKSVYASTVPRLYQYIIVDQQFSRFNNEKEYGYKRTIMEERKPVSFSCTYINSSYNFKRFLKVCGQLDQSKFQEVEAGATTVKRFDCIDLPDSLNLYDHELNDQLITFISGLHHLRQLVWLNDNFKLEYLHYLPNKNLINTLVLNIKFSNYMNELDDPTSECAGLVFPNLVNFQIQPFQNSKKLVKIVNNLLLNQAGDPKSVSRNLKTLILSRYYKSVDNNYMLSPNCSDLITRSTAIRDEENSLTALFQGSKLRYLSNLTSLSLDNMSVKPDDAHVFIKSVNLGTLQTLMFRGISEFQIIEQSNSLRPSFLLEISPHLKELKHLGLDFRQAVVDSVPEFLQQLPGKRKLESLDLVVRNNATKSYLDSGVEERGFYGLYGASIVLYHHTLKKLSVEIREEVSGYNESNNLNILKWVPPQTDFYQQLRQLDQLECLRISPGENVEEVGSLVGALASLKRLDIFGNKAGGAPNLGLGMVHPSIYDEWFKVQHVALLYLQWNRSLEYIRINQCVFDCNYDMVNPRSGISRWFEDSVRVRPLV